MTCIANIRINQETKRKEINYKFAGAISFNVFYLGFLLQNPILSSIILKLLRITKRNKMKSSAVKPFLVFSIGMLQRERKQTKKITVS